MDATYIDLTIRLSLALVLGGAIGIEREYSCQGGWFPHSLPGGLGKCAFLCGFAVWIRI